MGPAHARIRTEDDGLAEVFRRKRDATRSSGRCAESGREAIGGFAEPLRPRFQPHTTASAGRRTRATSRFCVRWSRQPCSPRDHRVWTDPFQSGVCSIARHGTGANRGARNRSRRSAEPDRWPIFLPRPARSGSAASCTRAPIRPRGMATSVRARVHGVGGYSEGADRSLAGGASQDRPAGADRRTYAHRRAARSAASLPRDREGAGAAPRSPKIPRQE